MDGLTGLELLNGVRDEYVAACDNAKNKNVFLRYVLPAAACLLLIFGMLLITGRTSPKPPNEHHELTPDETVPASTAPAAEPTYLPSVIPVETPLPDRAANLVTYEDLIAYAMEYAAPMREMYGLDFSYNGNTAVIPGGNECYVESVAFNPYMITLRVHFEMNQILRWNFTYSELIPDASAVEEIEDGLIWDHELFPRVSVTDEALTAAGVELTGTTDDARTVARWFAGLQAAEFMRLAQQDADHCEQAAAVELFCENTGLTGSEAACNTGFRFVMEPTHFLAFLAKHAEDGVVCGLEGQNSTHPGFINLGTKVVKALRTEGSWELSFDPDYELPPSPGNLPEPTPEPTLIPAAADLCVQLNDNEVYLFDIDGDGQTDSVRYYVTRANQWAEEFAVEIIMGSDPDDPYVYECSFTGCVFVVDSDPTDGRLEIIAADIGPSGDPESTIIRVKADGTGFERFVTGGALIGCDDKYYPGMTGFSSENGFWIEQESPILGSHFLFANVRIGADGVELIGDGYLYRQSLGYTLRLDLPVKLLNADGSVGADYLVPAGQNFRPLIADDVLADVVHVTVELDDGRQAIVELTRDPDSRVYLINGVDQFAYTDLPDEG